MIVLPLAQMTTAIKYPLQVILVRKAVLMIAIVNSVLYIIVLVELIGEYGAGIALLVLGIIIFLTVVAIGVSISMTEANRARAGYNPPTYGTVPPAGTQQSYSLPPQSPSLQPPPINHYAPQGGVQIVTMVPVGQQVPQTGGYASQPQYAQAHVLPQGAFYPPQQLQAAPPQFQQGGGGAVDPLNLSQVYHSMSEETEQSLQLQIEASSGTSAQLAVNTLLSANEGSSEGNPLFHESCAFVMLLLVPWDRANNAHLAAKLHIATSLRNLGVVEALFGQFTFCATQWGGYIGDCGAPCLISLLELVRYFPDVKYGILAKPEIVMLIKQQAQHKRGELLNVTSSPSSATDKDDAGSAAMKLEQLLQ